MEMNMEIRNKVIERLKSYPELVQKRDILRYELEHPAMVSDDEMLEAMSFLKGEGSSIPLGGVSNKTMYIALNYHEKADKLNTEARNDLVKRLLPLEQEISRLEYYMKHLRDQEREVLQEIYFEGRTLQEAANIMEATIWTVRKLRDSAVERLTEMYSFVENGG